MTKAKELIGQATPEQIEDWKKKHGKIWGIIVDGRICYLKKPDRKTLGYASVAGKDNPLKFNEIMLNSCFIGGCEDIKTDDDLFLSAGAKLADIIQIKEAELVNL